ncbi:DUF2850 domain-containing protein [Vibrio tritonius]|uniref:DUF2850 domain-containing protein n=1 Tax=Vibrio tritonius TaxID=1435069 RepID=A0ABS7YKF5_9VIBR|nr:DUF2850 domain-containing protein [Vibrio tritonius]MCA2014944.1 DUF2850 domain-containing protein [Vibrio tritonius]
MSVSSNRNQTLRAVRMSNILLNEKIFKAVFFSISFVILVVSGVYGYDAYKAYINPSNVYGKWIEVGTPTYQTDILRLSEKGVYRNNHLISTTFEFNGSTVSISTGDGVTKYELTGGETAPQLKRVKPSLPSQTLVKHGYEHKVEATAASNGSQDRRLMLSEHFKEGK